MSRVALALLAAGCAVVGLSCLGGAAPGDHYYRLAEPRPAEPLEAPLLAGGLRVERPRAGPLLEGTRLLWRDAERPSELRRLAYHHWSDAPTRLLAERLVGFLRGAHVASRVAHAELRSRAEYTLASRLHRFERVADADGVRAILELEVTLLGEADREVLYERRYAEAEPVRGEGAAAAVEAWDRALARLLERLLADLARELPPADLARELPPAGGDVAWRS